MKQTSFFSRKLRFWAALALVVTLPGLENAQAAETKTPQIQPGTFKITIRARAVDGAKPIGSQCHIESDQPQQVVRSKPQEPDVRGADGDWVIYNVTRDKWYVTILADDFAWSLEANTRRLNLQKAEDLTLNFTLLRGSTIQGRVVEGVTGKPIKGALVSGGDWDRCRDETDGKGRFTVKHLNPGKSVGVMVKKKDYVPMWSPVAPVEEGGTATVADTKMFPGGWISGRIVAPADAPNDGSVNGGLMPRFEDKEKQWANSVIESIRTGNSKEGFRLGPLQPGTYTLEAWLNTGKPWPGHPHRSWKGKIQHVQVELGQETKSIEIPVQETKN
jgi:hypothetical protein